MAVSRRLRFEILRRDGHRCRYCGKTAAENELTVDHVVPVALGGTDTPDNLVACCRDCNAGKSSIPADAAVVEDVKADALRWARAMMLAAGDQLGERMATDAFLDEFDGLWERWGWGQGDSRRTFPRPDDYEQTVRYWFAQGLEMDVLSEAIEVTMRKELPTDRRWRYFCGVVWKVLRDRQDRARRLIELNDPDLEGFAPE